METKYIEKQAAIDAIYSVPSADWVKERYMIEVGRIPPADVRPVVRGRWELAKDGWYCTACELYPPFDCDPEEKGIPFCPMCGATMEYNDA